MGQSHYPARCRYLLTGLASLAVLASFSHAAQAQFLSQEMVCTPSVSTNPIEVNNVTPKTGSGSATQTGVDVSCKSWHVVDTANNITAGAYCVGIPLIASETADARIAYLDGIVGNPYITFQFSYAAGGGASVIGDGIAVGYGATVYGKSVGATTPPLPGDGYDLGKVANFLTVVVPGNQQSSDLVEGVYISAPRMMNLWVGTGGSETYFNTLSNRVNCQSAFPNSAAQPFGPVTVRITVKRSCSLTATPVVFPDVVSSDVVSGAVPMATGKITATCDTKDGYSIKIDGGKSGNWQNRLMTPGGIAGATPAIRYELYRPGTNDIWGNTDASRHIDSGFVGDRDFEVRAAIPAQAPPASGFFPSGDYKDEVKVTLEPYP